VFPAWQMLFAQHPEHAPGPQTHVPFWHCVPDGHATHTIPLEPHAWLLVPALHSLFSQQPVHVPGPQTLTQEPFSHCVPVGQVTHTAPAVPQS
jgi:hypothetical protein